MPSSMPSILAPCNIIRSSPPPAQQRRGLPRNKETPVSRRRRTLVRVGMTAGVAALGLVAPLDTAAVAVLQNSRVASNSFQTTADAAQRTAERCRDIVGQTFGALVTWARSDRQVRRLFSGRRRITILLIAPHSVQEVRHVRCGQKYLCARSICVDSEARHVRLYGGRNIL